MVPGTKLHGHFYLLPCILFRYLARLQTIPVCFVRQVDVPVAGDMKLVSRVSLHQLQNLGSYHAVRSSLHGFRRPGSALGIRHATGLVCP